MNEIYLKIFVENGNTIVFEGQGLEEKHGYYPTRCDEIAKRIGTVVIGKEHISITNEAKIAFKRIIKEAQYTGNDLSCLDIYSCKGKNEDDVCVSYLGPVVTRWNIEEIIHDNNFFIGIGEGLPQVILLDKLILVEHTS